MFINIYYIYINLYGYIKKEEEKIYMFIYESILVFLSVYVELL